MPNIELIPVPLYSALQPYHYDYDNLPVKALMTRMELVNSAVDINGDILRNAVGSAGSLSARLNQSINPDGSLKSDAIDEELHAIGAHTDGEWEGVDYVRMLATERAKMSTVADNATDMRLSFETISNVVLFEQGPIAFEASSSIKWQVVAPSVVKAHMVFPSSAAHRHYYNITPQDEGLTPDFQNYKVGYPTFISGSLRVYINGVRLTDDDEVYVPGPLVSSAWALNSFTPDPENGTFSLLTAITSGDVIRIDFDISLA